MHPDPIDSCDIFCSVVDNYGDIGVCWRLARQLANEQDISVRLWVDDLYSFRKLCPVIQPELALQHSHAVEIRHWAPNLPELIPAQLVIETFACELPESYVRSMALRAPKPVWINLEYLSAENWVAGCHGLQSPHLRLPLLKYFFFPGFTDDTGGLLLEQGLLARRDAFQGDAEAQRAYWQTWSIPPRVAGEVRVSLFSYENPGVASLLSAWAAADNLHTCLVPEGRVLPQVADFFKCQQLQAGAVMQQGNLRVHVLPFVEQDAYDKLLWACDINFVRGEDSCVRAQWAGKPWIWHIYPQHDGVHMQKLQALLDLYCQGLDSDCAAAMGQLWRWWNDAATAEPAHAAKAWEHFLACQNTLQQHTRVWAGQLATNNLALNLLDFSRKVGKIAAFKI
jgi:uncharacterized repeat protein (TIGR03837 family)